METTTSDVWRHVLGTIESWARMLRFFWQLSPGPVTSSALLALVTAVIPALQVNMTMMTVQKVADAVQSHGAPALIRDGVFLVFGLAALSVTAHILNSWQQYLQSLLQFRLLSQVSERIMAKAIRLDLQHYEDDKCYDSLQRANNESAYRPYLLFSEMIGSGQRLISLLSVTAILFSWNAWIGLFILLSPVPSVIASVIYGQRGYQIEHERAANRRHLSYFQYLVTSDRAFKEICLFGLGPVLLDRFQALTDGFFEADRSLARRRSLLVALLGLLGVVISCTALLYALVDTISTGMVGQFAGFAQAIGVVQSEAQGLLFGLGSLYQNGLFAGNLFKFFDLAEAQVKSGHRQFPEHLEKGIEFRGVSFVYPGTTTKAIDRLSCIFPADKCVAVVGHNGAGKTTLVKLLARLYEPTEGQILIDGIPIEEYDLEDLRRNIGIIFQDFVQYEMTARENIGFGRVEELHDEERIRIAAYQSGVAPIIEDLPGQYDAMLGRTFQEGNQLSFGQWQKVALARAFMRHAPVVVLDEPTASIDAEAEMEIFGRLREIAKSATALLIAHRFSTVRIADHIIVMENGRLIEEGNHESLMETGGMYAHLFTLQADGYR
ncbi:MAG: ABC transporter ATP-binding protein [Candidatus Dormibacteria bacterium]